MDQAPIMINEQILENRNLVKINPHRQDPNIRAELIQKLNYGINHLSSVQNIENFEIDTVFKGLEDIQKKATQYQLNEIKRIAALAMGKRILNVEIQKKKKQIENKKQKKKIIEDYFRQNRIKQVDFEKKALQKIKQNTLIVQPYSSGKAFVESENIYTCAINLETKQNYRKALTECEYLATIKNVNRIFFKNYSRSSSIKTQSIIFSSIPVRICISFIVLLLLFCGLANTFDVPKAEYGILILNFLIIALILWISIGSFFSESNDNYQLTETIQQITQYFSQLNKINKNLGKQFQWNCPKQFMYLEVIFDRQYNILDR